MHCVIIKPKALDRCTSAVTRAGTTVTKPASELHIHITGQWLNRLSPTCG